MPLDGVTEADVVVGLDDAFESEPVDAGAPVKPEIDVSFLAGVAPGDESPAPAELPRVDVTPAPVVEPANVFEATRRRSRGRQPGRA